MVGHERNVHATAPAISDTAMPWKMGSVRLRWRPRLPPRQWAAWGGSE